MDWVGNERNLLTTKEELTPSLCVTTLGHRSPGKTRLEQSHLHQFIIYRKLRIICLEALEVGMKSHVGLLRAPPTLALSSGRSQSTLTFPKQMEGGAGKGLALKEEISAVCSHKIPRAWEHS